MVASQTRWSVFWFSQISNGIKCSCQSLKCGEKNASSRQCWKCEMSNCQKAMKDYFLNDRVFLQLSTWWRLLTTRDAGRRGGRPSSGCHHRHHRHRHCKLEYFQLLCCITLLHIAPQYFTIFHAYKDWPNTAQCTSRHVYIYMRHRNLLFATFCLSTSMGWRHT